LDCVAGSAFDRPGIDDRLAECFNAGPVADHDTADLVGERPARQINGDPGCGGRFDRSCIDDRSDTFDSLVIPLDQRG
jgi:hypothetical protein